MNGVPVAVPIGSLSLLATAQFLGDCAPKAPTTLDCSWSAS